MATLISKNIGPVEFACVVSEAHTSEVEATDNPVETGSDVTDHVFMKPKRLTVEVADRSLSLYDDLVAFQETRQPFTMVTGLSIYENMIMTSIDVDRDVSTGDVIKATVMMRELIVVSTGAAPINGPVRANSAQPGGDNSTNAVAPGAENTSTDTADNASATVVKGDTDVETVPDSQSILKKVFG